MPRATSAPRLRCLVAELPDGEIVGYATCAPEVSTWGGCEYLHMDCLFLRDGHRGLGLGQRLMDAVLAEARALGLREVPWQTPARNEGAIRFYDRLGAQGGDKRRCALTRQDGPWRCMKRSRLPAGSRNAQSRTP